ncbi:MAG: PD-(D/E)XK nuclease family protein [Fimbriimonadales bacterium]|nr:PD-(D/E)XK nuclease family protein [Fimbriimonadales bacterium]
MRKPIFSPTKLSTYLLCRLKYHWAYQTPYGRWMRRPNPAFALGTNLHRTLQFFHDAGGVETLTPDAVHQALEQLWSHAGFESLEQSEAYKQTGLELVQQYYQAQREQPQEAVVLFTERTLRRDMGRYILTGRLDRVDERPDGALEIIDYKSGRTHVDEEQVRNDLALHCYALLLQEQYPDRPLWIAIYALRVNKKVAVHLSPEELQAFRQMLDQLVAQILDEDWAVLTPRWIPHCAECEFLELCMRHLGLTPTAFTDGVSEEA